ncbi:TetR family transcriptional regulator [Intrasporangium sp.]|uniref:TetR/AcrR family transcriptional regulator n=1 Tax=Intrasporangium sp. TaxID=1925024 RepID=UPI002939B2A0|nr:TetR family transcriptional regulator [Intrasporangium sp.]MDV3221393.1 TetR family transcriptional regulator [Intrasporangium sp.]
MSRRPGPRADRADVRGDILAAARALFASRGFKGTTMRAVADGAGVDVALVPYYFGNKDGLFAASLELPIDPHEKIDEVFAQGLDGIGERIVRTVATILDDPVVGPALLGLMRSAMTEGAAHDVVRDFIDNVIIEGYARHLDRPDARERAALAATQIVGLAMGRRVVGIEPLASMSVDEVAAHVGPTIQRYLTGDLAPGPTRTS